MTNRLNHFQVGDARRERGPQAYGVGEAAVLAEWVPADCGCRGTWQLGEFTDGTTLRFGWWRTTSHSQACKRARA